MQNTVDYWDGRTCRRTLLIGGRPVAMAVTQSGSVESPRIDVVVTGARLGERWSPP
jgi:hypothetical protein